jgi:hypothetical protein
LISCAEPSGSESRVTPPAVMVPSTSIKKTVICLARFATREVIRAAILFAALAN